MKQILLTAALAFSLAALTGCGKSDPIPPSAEELRQQRIDKSAENRKKMEMSEQNRTTALENINTNVAAYFAANPRFQPAADWSVISHTDDYIEETCPAGSGWGWANIMSTKVKTEDGKPTKFKVYCSTVSSALGCYIENDFKAGPHFAKASKCNDGLATPIKPIAK